MCSVSVPLRGYPFHITWTVLPLKLSDRFRPLTGLSISYLKKLKNIHRTAEFVSVPLRGYPFHIYIIYLSKERKNKVSVPLRGYPFHIIAYKMGWDGCHVSVPLRGYPFHIALYFFILHFPHVSVPLRGYPFHIQVKNK